LKRLAGLEENEGLKGRLRWPVSDGPNAGTAITLSKSLSPEQAEAIHPCFNVRAAKYLADGLGIGLVELVRCKKSCPKVSHLYKEVEVKRTDTR
jgi:hypothetical protein